MLSDAALVFRNEIQDGAEFLSTCDGGDPGSIEEPSVWLLGIEPGWSLADGANAEAPSPEAEERLRAYSIELQLEWPFNRNAFKWCCQSNRNSSPHDGALALRARA